MSYDDLPTNLDHLDESFGTAAGLREMRDDDLDDEDVDIQLVISTQGVKHARFTSKVQERLSNAPPRGHPGQTIEIYFDNIPECRDP
jgi:autophagy-related protein 2